MINIASEDVDPFLAKAKESQGRLAKLLTNFQSLRANSDLFSSDTTLIYLVLKCNLILNDPQIKAVLGLGGIGKVQSTIYAAIQHEVRFAAQELFSRASFGSLLEMPLTDLKQLCYEIALNYKSIFFVPVESKVKVAANQSDAYSQLASYPVPSTNTSRNTSRGNYMPGSQDVQPSRFISTEDAALQENYTEFIEVVQFISKFNQMWIVAAFIHREYQELKKGSKTPNTSHE